MTAPSAEVPAAEAHAAFVPAQREDGSRPDPSAPEAAVRRDAAPAAPPLLAPSRPGHGVSPVALVVDELAPPLAHERRRQDDDKQDDDKDADKDDGTGRAPSPDAPPPSGAAAHSPGPADAATYPPHLDVAALSANLRQLMAEGSRAFAAFLTARDGHGDVAGSVSDAVATLAQVAEYWYADPQRTLEMQARLGADFLALFTSMSQRLAGEPAEPAAVPDRRDTRFRDPEWSSNQYFDFIKQAYLILADWGAWLIDHADAVDPAVRRRAEFYMRQIADALAPSNFLFTNPELLRTTLNRSADNLARGAAMFAEDVEAGGGDLKIRQSDLASFRVGGNLATTPGKVVHQNGLMQLIQYAPATGHVLRRPLLIVPPWINKYYVLDLAPANSFIRWCVAQGLTVFVISWVNPDGRHADKDFIDYMREGPLEALDAIVDITREDKVAALGYCVGGTLLAFTLAAMAARGDARIAAATLLAAQVDFTHAGDLKVFASTEAQVAAIEREMAQRGYLDGTKMATAFNMLRPNQLIWPYVVGSYLKGEAPFAHDLLYWNADSTRMTAANHSYYLRNCYLNNNLAKRALTAGDVTIDLSRITIPLYCLAARDDHIAPAKSVYLGSSLFGGPVRYVLSGSGHIAGVVNPPAAHKYCYFTGGPPQGGDDLDAWLGTAVMHEGSWWGDWMAWLRGHGASKVKARQPGSSRHAPIEDAPGSYVKVRT